MERTSETEDGKLVSKPVAPATFLRNLKTLDSKRKRGELIDSLTMSQNSNLDHATSNLESKMKTVKQWKMDLHTQKIIPKNDDKKRYRVLSVDLRSKTLNSMIYKHHRLDKEERKEIMNLARADFSDMTTTNMKSDENTKHYGDDDEDLLPVRTIIQRAWDYVKASLLKRRATSSTKKQSHYAWAVGLSKEARNQVTSAAVRLLQKETKKKKASFERVQKYRIQLLIALRADHLAADDAASSPKRRQIENEIRWESMKKVANQRMQDVLGSGMWNDAVASTLTKPLDSSILAPNWSGSRIEENMLVPRAKKAVRTLQRMVRKWHHRRRKAARSIQRSLRGFFVRLLIYRQRREERDVRERARRREFEREMMEKRRCHAVTRIQSATRSRIERNETRRGKRMSFLRYERVLRLLRKRLVTRLKRRRAVRTLIRWWRYRIRVLKFASACSIQYAWKRWLSRRKWRVRRFVLGVLQRFRTKRIRKMVVLKERVRSQAERSYVERVKKNFDFKKSSACDDKKVLRWCLRSQKLLRELQIRYLHEHVKCRIKKSVEILKMLIYTSFPHKRNAVTACSAEVLVKALNDVSFDISDKELTSLVRWMNKLGGRRDLDEDLEEDEEMSATEFETPIFDLILVSNSVEAAKEEVENSLFKDGAIFVLHRIARTIEFRFQDEAQLYIWAVRDVKEKLRKKLETAAILRFRSKYPPRVFCRACLQPFSTGIKLEWHRRDCEMHACDGMGGGPWRRIEEKVRARVAEERALELVKNKIKQQRTTRDVDVGDTVRRDRELAIENYRHENPPKLRCAKCREPLESVHETHQCVSSSTRPSKVDLVVSQRDKDSVDWFQTWTYREEKRREDIACKSSSVQTMLFLCSKQGKVLLEDMRAMHEKQRVDSMTEQKWRCVHERPCVRDKDQLYVFDENTHLERLSREAEDVFMLLDTNTSGVIQVHDFISALRVLGLRFENHTAEGSFQIIDNDGDGYITMKEFSKWFAYSYDAQKPRHDIRTRFAQFLSRMKRSLRRRAMDEARAKTSIMYRQRAFTKFREMEKFRLTSPMGFLKDDASTKLNVAWRHGRSDIFVRNRRSSELRCLKYRSRFSSVERDDLRFRISRLKENGYVDVDAVFAEFDDEAKGSIDKKKFEHAVVGLHLPYHDLDRIRGLFEKMKNRANRVEKNVFVKWFMDHKSRVDTCDTRFSRLRMR